AFWQSEKDDQLLDDLLDWLRAEALQENGDLFFPEEPPSDRDGARAYRQLICAWIAAAVGHPLATDARFLSRLRQYHDSKSGGVYAYIGEDAQAPNFDGGFGSGEAVFFGEYALAAKDWERADSVARWVLELVDRNRSSMTDDGMFFYTTDNRGEVVTSI